MPLCLITSTADSFRLALDDADAHIRTHHRTVSKVSPTGSAYAEDRFIRQEIAA